MKITVNVFKDPTGREYVPLTRKEVRALFVEPMRTQEEFLPTQVAPSTFHWKGRNLFRCSRLVDPQGHMYEYIRPIELRYEGRPVEVTD